MPQLAASHVRARRFGMCLVVFVNQILYAILWLWNSHATLSFKVIGAALQKGRAFF
jgi:hypothetical protein